MRNPGIPGLIETLAGPVIAAILYLMPIQAIHKLPARAPYRGRLANIFVTMAGLVTTSGILDGILW